MPTKRSTYNYSNGRTSTNSPQRAKVGKTGVQLGGSASGAARSANGAARSAQQARSVQLGSSANKAARSAQPTRSAQQARSAGRTTSRTSAQVRTGRPGADVRGGRPNANSQLAFSRRALVGGAIGVGALAVAGGGAALAIRQAQENAAGDFDVLNVPASNMTTNSELSEIEDASTCMGLVGNFDLPLGTLVWCNDDDFAACLVPAEGANPLTQIGLLALGSGTLTTVLDSAVGLANKFEIFDVRATSRGIIWVEANILDGVWRVYSAATNGTALTGDPVLLEEQACGLWETPTLAIVGNKVFWQMQPQQTGEAASENSVLKGATAGRDDASIIYEQRRRFACAPYGGTDSVTIVPHKENLSSYYELTCINAATGEIRDTCVLPASYTPSHAGYGDTGFMFCLDAIYNTTSDEGIGNLGTYVPTETTSVQAGTAALGNMPWFAFTRTPLTSPCWCGKYLMVKSTTAVCGIDLDTKEYFVLEVESGADDYGEFLASEGSRDTVVTYTRIDYTPLDGKTKQLTRVKVYAPIA